MMLSGFIQSIISITDGAFLARYSSEAYEAAGGAGLWYITLHMIFVGLNDGAQIKMANAIGEKNTFNFNKTFQSNVIIIAFAAILLSLFVYFCLPNLLDYLIPNNSELAKNQYRFLEIRSFSFVATILSLPIQASFLATGKTKIVMFGSILIALSNVILGYLLIFGNSFFPELGMEGAALASTIAEFIGMFFFLTVLFFQKPIKEFSFFQKNKKRIQGIYENLKVGFPLMLQGLVALLVWTIFFIWIEQSGDNNLRISLNIRYIYFLAFIPVWGYAGTTKTYIAQYAGAKMFDKIPLIQKKMQRLALISLVIVFHGSILYPEKLISIITDKPDEIVKSAQILMYISGSILVYGISSVYFQTIAGLGKTRYSFYIELLATFSYILSAYLFIKVWNLEIQYVWLVEYIYFISLGLASFIYLKSNKKIFLNE